MILEVFVGDLGLNTGPPQSVYFLDVDNLTKIAGAGLSTKVLFCVQGRWQKSQGALAV